MMRKGVNVTLAVLLISALLIPALASGGEAHPEIVKPYIPGSNDKNYVPTEPHGVMRPDAETRQEWAEMARTGSRAYIDPDIKKKRASYSLLSYLQYTPSERNQLSCGDCWVWAGTGCMAIALNRQEGIKDRLSIQLLNSCYGTGTNYPCCGGYAEDFGDWYNSRGYCIPWSNSNASFQDANRGCSDGSSLVSCGSISTSTRYNINSCSTSYVTTHGVSQATAIANIKNVLQQGKAVWFGFYVPTKADGDAFEYFWDNYGEYTHHWNYDDSCGKTWNNGWGHAVLCVGWYEDGSKNQYWEILNSWGTTSGRPNGIYLVKMDMNYNCQYWDSYYSRWDYMHSWATYDFDFGSSGGSDYRVLDGGDYNGDGHDDIAIFRPSSGLWSVRGITRVYWGASGDIPIPGDYDGNGTTRLGIFRPSSGLWAIQEYNRFYYGSSSDTPVPNDYTGTGRCNPGIFRPSSGLWSIYNITRCYFGGSSDKPVPADYNGDGTSQMCIFRESSGLWACRNSFRAYFGTSGDIPYALDPYNYAAGVGIFRPSSGLWAISGYSRFYFGGSTDQPVPANFIGGAGDDIAIFRQSSGLWAIMGGNRYYYGTSGDIPVTR